MDIKYLYINTIGCQMNVYDSEKIASVLRPLGYRITSSLEMAELIIINTCAIRKKAEQKAYSFLGRLENLKRKKPDLIIGMGGCVAQQEGEKILRRMPGIDLVFGTHAIGRLPGHIQQIEKKGRRIVDIQTSESIQEFESAVDPQIDGQPTCFVTIMQGCDNFCTYCVVPYVRGRETSRRPENILKEIGDRVKCGAREVTLLGQNVNSYGKKEGMRSFPKLLSLVNDIEKLRRIRFTTSHPKDLSEDLIGSFKNLEKLCNHIHLPVQSGSNRILERMNRKYTRELYLEKIDKLRRFCPDIAITSDIIVGFPGETRKDFNETLDLIKSVEYDNLFAFMYSDRPNTLSSSFSDKIEDLEKKDRLQAILDIQSGITIKKNEALVGSDHRVLVEGLSHKQDETDQQVQWKGRTSTNKIVNFISNEQNMPGMEIRAGKMVTLRIEKAFPHSLRGKPVGVEPSFLGLKGESYAA
jgi:tRNA-2-methylthio-N6-dimethylallyladenosine synthase